MKAKEFDKKFDDNEEDTIDDLDLSTAKRLNQEQRRIDISFPVWVLDSLDKEANRTGVSLESIIKIWLVERLEEQESRKRLREISYAE